MLRYDIRQDQWSVAGETPAARATVPTVEWSGLTIIPGGETRPGVRSPEVWALSVKADR
jgi:N-acetylneuraminic acid mutarotase